MPRSHFMCLYSSPVGNCAAERLDYLIRSVTAGVQPVPPEVHRFHFSLADRSAHRQWSFTSTYRYVNSSIELDLHRNCNTRFSGLPWSDLVNSVAAEEQKRLPNLAHVQSFEFSFVNKARDRSVQTQYNLSASMRPSDGYQAL